MARFSKPKKEPEPRSKKVQHCRDNIEIKNVPEPKGK